jgi:hypothetical protein
MCSGFCFYGAHLSWTSTFSWVENTGCSSGENTFVTMWYPLCFDQIMLAIHDLYNYERYIWSYVFFFFLLFLSFPWFAHARYAVDRSFPLMLAKATI